MDMFLWERNDKSNNVKLALNICAYVVISQKIINGQGKMPSKLSGFP